MEWALVDKLRTKAEKSGSVGVCPGCGGEVRAKCGEIVSWHWAHINADCDSWSEPETEWHRKWKGYFPADWQEVTKPPHRADVAGPDGVLEIQRSGISPEEIRERQDFYGRMAWLLNGHDFWENLEWIKAAGDYHEFRWKHARKTWIEAGWPIFIDTPLGLFSVKKIKDGAWKVICGSFVKASSLTQALDKSGKTQASMELLLYDSLAETARQELFVKAGKLLDLYYEYESLYRTAWSSTYSPPPKWREYRTEHYFLLKADPRHVSAVFDQYKEEISEAKLRIKNLEIEKQKAKAQQQQLQRNREIQRAIDASSVTINAENIHRSSENKRLPGKLNWTQILAKTGIPEPAWEARQ